MENELFGHERRAFTDAGSGQRGLIAEAKGGTLLLDEIDCLPLLAQVKFLRFLQEKEYRPLGATKTKTASVRIITATNANLEDAVHQGTLRRDLYYRLNILNILPLGLLSLRDRPEDILLLAKHFLTKFVAEFAKPVSEFSPEVPMRTRPKNEDKYASSLYLHLVHFKTWERLEVCQIGQGGRNGGTENT